MSKLFSPIRIGAFDLSHRVVLAPLTRMRADVPGNVPNDLMAKYYQQRASEGGLMITEATFTSPTGNGGYASPGAGLASRSRCSRHWCRYWWGKVRPIKSELALCNADAVAPWRLPYLQSMPPSLQSLIRGRQQNLA